MKLESRLNRARARLAPRPEDVSYISGGEIAFLDALEEHARNSDVPLKDRDNLDEIVNSILEGGGGIR